jgi:transposase-like protein
LLSRQATGGESVSAFCLREGLSPNSFRRWRARLAPGALAATPRQAVSVQSAQAACGFVDLGVLGDAVPSASRLEITLDLGGGIRLSLVRG